MKKVKKKKKEDEEGEEGFGENKLEVVGLIGLIRLEIEWLINIEIKCSLM